MKKVELHLHLDGSLNVAYASKLCGYDCRYDLVSRDAPDLKSYLEKFDLPGELLEDYDAIVGFSYLLGKKLEEDNVIYAEIRFCPFFHDKKISVDRVITGIRVGLSRVHSVKTNLIFCMMRHFSFEENMKIVRLAQKYYGNGCVALDLAGDEANFKTKGFERLFDEVRKTGIPFTIHAGEADGAESVKDALSFGAKRIGHGIRCLEDDDVLRKVIENKICLEVCPNSNLDTKVVESYEAHPIKILDDVGCMITVSTDNRTVSEITLESEYNALMETFGYTNADMFRFNMNAIEAAFLSEEEKQELRDMLRED